MLSDLTMLRVACRVVEAQQDDETHSHSKPRILLPSTSAAATSSFPIRTSSTNTNAMHLLPRLHPQLANMPLPAIHISTATDRAGPGSRDGRRIAPMQQRTPPPTAAMATHAADLMLGLKRLAHQRDDEQHEDDDHDHEPRPIKRARGQNQSMRESTTKSETPMRLPSPPGVFMSSPLAALVHAQRAAPLPSIRSPMEASSPLAASMETPRDGDPSQPWTAMHVCFPEKRRHDDRVNASVSIQATSPTSVWEDAHSDSCLSSGQHSPVKSPCSSLYTHAVRPQISTLRVPTLHQWRAPHGMMPRVASSHSAPLVPSRPPSSLPTLPEASLPCQAASSQSIPMPTTRPTLMRKSSSQWRQEMPTQDRETTRERIQRGLHTVCRGDYEAVLRIVSAMEEELLHLHTTSKDHYFLQALALRDRIHALRPGHTTLSS